MMHKLPPRQGSLELDLNERPMTHGDGCAVHDDVDPAGGPDRITDQRVGASQCWGTILVVALDKLRQITII